MSRAICCSLQRQCLSCWALLSSLTHGNESQRQLWHVLFCVVNTWVFLSCRRSVWWLILRMLRSPQKPGYGKTLRWILLIVYFSVSMLAPCLHEVFPKRWNPLIRKLHEKIFQICANCSVSQTKPNHVLRQQHMHWVPGSLAVKWQVLNKGSNLHKKVLGHWNRFAFFPFFLFLLFSEEYTI